MAVALSGGSDSLALLHLMHQLYPDIAITALTVDHQLREDSSYEAMRVNEWMKALDIPHQILKWEHHELQGNLQSNARNARYHLMSEWCLANKTSVLLLGHTQDDQAETIAYQQERSAGPVGLAGMSGARMENNIQLLRPLLGHTRAELQDWLGTQQFPWINDPSNQNTAFARVRIRQQLTENPNEKAELLALGQKMALQRLQIEQDHAKFIEQHITVNDTHLICPLIAFLKLTEDQAAYTLGRILCHIGGDDYPPRYAKRLNALNNIKVNKNQRFTLGHCFIKTQQEQLHFSLEQNSTATRAKPLVPSPFVPIFNS
ncbi:MAG: tRNA lysidine(34) synthetase TilS [Rickettsiales bacterium]|nr:tRNA lysidine(34) synthetase TilS [Rickettsiales bacterium]